MADQQRGDRVKVNGEQYVIDAIKDCSSSGSKFFGKCRFTLRKVADGSMWEAFGKRVVHNSRLTSKDAATPTADQVADASGDQVADASADQVAPGFTYVDDCVYATDPATVVDIQAGDTIRVEYAGGTYAEPFTYESTVVAVDRDEFGLYFGTVRVIPDNTGREPSAFWTETQASTTVHKITRVDGAPTVDVSADDYADALEWARDLYAARSARPAAPATATEIIRARRAEYDQVATESGDQVADDAAADASGDQVDTVADALRAVARGWFDTATPIQSMSVRVQLQNAALSYVSTPGAADALRAIAGQYPDDRTVIMHAAVRSNLIAHAAMYAGDQGATGRVREIIAAGTWSVAIVGSGRSRFAANVLSVGRLASDEYAAVRETLRTLGGVWRKGYGFVWEVPATPTGPWDGGKRLSGPERVGAWLAPADQVPADASGHQVADAPADSDQGAAPVAVDQVAADASAAPVAPAFVQRTDIGRKLRSIRGHLGHVTRPGTLIRVDERYGDRIVISGADIDTAKLSEIMCEPYRLEEARTHAFGSPTWSYVPAGRPVPPVSAERDQTASGDQVADAMDDTDAVDTDATAWRSMRATEEAADQVAPVAGEESAPAIGSDQGATDASGDQVADDATADQVAPVDAVQFTAPRDQVADAFAYVAAGAPKRPSVAVLGGALITADAAGVTVATFDYEQSRTVRLAAQVVTPGRVLVPCHKVADIVKVLPATVKEITFVTDAAGTKVTITAGASVYTVATLPVEDYPTITPVAGRIGTVNVHALADTVAYVLPAVGDNDTLPMLTCFRIIPGAKRIDITATNRYVATDAVVTWSRDDDETGEKILVPGKPFADALKIIAAGTDVADCDAVIGHSDTDVSVSAGRYTFVIRTADGQSYPPIQNLFRPEYGATGTVEAKAFMDAVKRVTVGAEKADPIRLTWSADAVTIASGTNGTGAREAIACEYNGADGFMFAVNPSYLVGLIKTMVAKPSKPAPKPARGTKAPAPRVTFGAVDAHATVNITEADAGAFSPRHMIMPIRTGAAVEDRTAAAAVAAAPGAAMIPAPTNRKEDTMPATPADTDGAATPTAPAAPAKPTSKGAKKSSKATPAPAAAPTDQPSTDTAPAMDSNQGAPAFTADEADQLERIAQDAHEKLTAGDYRGALAIIATGEAMAPSYLVAGEFPWSVLRDEIAKVEAENTPAAADQVPALTPADAVALDAAQEAATAAMVAAPPAAPAKPATVDQGAPAAPAGSAASAEAVSYPFRLAPYDAATGVTYSAARAAVRDALRAAGLVVRVDKGADRRDMIVTTDAPADQVAAIAAAAAVLAADDDARPVSAVPAVRPLSDMHAPHPVRPVSAVPANATARDFVLATYTETGVTYNAARDAIREALRAAGIAARVSKGADKRDAVVTTDAPADQVAAIVAAAAALAVTADA